MEDQRVGKGATEDALTYVVINKLEKAMFGRQANLEQLSALLQTGEAGENGYGYGYVLRMRGEDLKDVTQ